MCNEKSKIKNQSAFLHVVLLGQSVCCNYWEYTGIEEYKTTFSILRFISCEDNQQCNEVLMKLITFYKDDVT